MHQHHPFPRLAFQASMALLVAGLVACGGGKGSTPAAGATPETTTQPPATPSAPTMKEQLAELERTGVLPQLDRSTDLAGPDADNNGIRDDIDAYIAALPVSEPVKKAARQRARVQQKINTIDLNDRAALMELADASMASTACMSETSRAGLPLDQQEAARKSGSAITFKLQAITANTPERAERYLAYMRALHGTTTTYPEGKVCEDQ